MAACGAANAAASSDPSHQTVRNSNPELEGVLLQTASEIPARGCSRTSAPAPRAGAPGRDRRIVRRRGAAVARVRGAEPIPVRARGRGRSVSSCQRGACAAEAGANDAPAIAESDDDGAPPSPSILSASFSTNCTDKMPMKFRLSFALTGVSPNRTWLLAAEYRPLSPSSALRSLWTATVSSDDLSACADEPDASCGQFDVLRVRASAEYSVALLMRAADADDDAAATELWSSTLVTCSSGVPRLDSQPYVRVSGDTPGWEIATFAAEDYYLGDSGSGGKVFAGLIAVDAEGCARRRSARRLMARARVRERAREWKSSRARRARPAPAAPPPAPFKLRRVAVPRVLARVVGLPARLWHRAAGGCRLARRPRRRHRRDARLRRRRRALARDQPAAADHAAGPPRLAVHRAVHGRRRSTTTSSRTSAASTRAARARRRRAARARAQSAKVLTMRTRGKRIPATTVLQQFEPGSVEDSVEDTFYGSEIVMEPRDERDRAAVRLFPGARVGPRG